jgi:hypothetical protein
MMTPLIDTNQPSFPSRGASDVASRPAMSGRTKLAVVLFVPAMLTLSVFVGSTDGLLNRISNSTVVASLPTGGETVQKLASGFAPLLRATEMFSSVVSASQGYLEGFKMEDGGAGG